MTDTDSFPLEQSTCRICHDAGCEPLIRPCNCTGTLAGVHRRCLEQWMKQRRSDHFRCEICRFQFRHRLRTRSPLAFLLAWRAWREWLHLLYIGFLSRRMWTQVESLGALVLPGSTGKGRVEGMSKALLYVVVSVHYVGFLAFDLRSMFKRYMRWSMTTADIVVYGKDEPIPALDL